MAPRFRTAGPDDAGQVARLHADSWRRFYRGAYADAFLDGDVVADRRAVWSSRLAAPGGGALTLLAEEDPGGPAASGGAESPDAPGGSDVPDASEGVALGFVHVVFDEDPVWGSLVDNLHVTAARRRTGVGRALLTRAAGAAVARASGPGLYLWVLEQNAAAQGFYTALGAVHVETLPVEAPGGDLSRLHGSPKKFRMSWPDAGRLAEGAAASD